MKTVEIELPEDVIAEVGIEDIRRVAREALLVKLYDLGTVSSERAAEILGVSPGEFLDILDEYSVSEFDDSVDVGGEAGRG